MELPIKTLSQLNFDNSRIIFPGTNNVHVVSAQFRNQTVAIKFFKDKNIKKIKQSLLNQSRIMYRMSKDDGFLKIYGALIEKVPNSVRQQLDITTKDKYGILIMEFCDYDLKQYMKLIQEKSKREQLTLKFGKILISSMKRLNNKGIKHKDLKPQNILLIDKGENPSIKIADFDVSTSYQKQVEATISCKTNVAGTFSYASPEVRKLLESKVSGKVKFNPNKADVY